MEQYQISFNSFGKVVVRVTAKNGKVTLARGTFSNLNAAFSYIAEDNFRRSVA